VKHPVRCENAKRPVCRCGVCGGSLHGWPYALTLTKPKKAPERADLRVAAEQAWAEAAAPGRSILQRYRNRRKARAAVKSAKADVIDWLASMLTAPPLTVGQAESQLVQPLGDLVSTKVFAALCEAAGENERKARGEFARNHLFCSLLAASACAMQQVSDDLNNIITVVAGRLTTYMIGDEQVQNSPLLAGIAADTLAKGMKGLVGNLPVVQQFSQLQRAAQILAPLMCPAPDKHEEVIRCCLKPLGAPMLSQAVQDRLKEAFPDWMQ
jgi:hypothetical protein